MMNPITEEKIDSIENTPEKAIVRAEISAQVLEMGKSEIHGATLPAVDYFFEKSFTNLANKRGTKVSFDCAEMDFRTAVASMRHIPQNCRLANVDYSYMMNKPMFWSDKTPVGFSASQNQCISTLTLDETIKGYKHPLYGLIWPDYCGEATEEMLLNFVDMLLNNVDPNGGVGYITVYMVSRNKGQDDYFKRFSQYSKDTTVYGVIRDTLDKMISRIKNRNIRCVYQVAYHGAHGQPMLTIGYSVNVPANKITPIIENRIGIEREHKLRRFRISLRLMENGWKMLRIGRQPGTVVRNSTTVKADRRYKKNKLTDNLPLYQAVRYYKDKWNDMDREKKVRVCSRLGMSINQFASRIAWFHGGLKDKRMAA